MYGGNTLKTICRLSLSRDSCVKKTERFFGRWGVRVLAVAKFVPGLSIVSIPMAGAMGARYRTFLTYDSIGAALWSGTGLIIGALFARQIDMLFAMAGRLGRTAALVAVALLLLYAAYRWIRRRQLISKLATQRSKSMSWRRCRGRQNAGAVRYPLAGKARARSVRDSGLAIRRRAATRRDRRNVPARSEGGDLLFVPK
jgi:Uncharacterized membrane-associated protein